MRCMTFEHMDFVQYNVSRTLSFYYVLLNVWNYNFLETRTLALTKYSLLRVALLLTFDIGIKTRNHRTC